MAEIITDILGEFRSGLYATFSMVKPKSAVSSTTSGMVIYKGSAADRYTIIRPATINTSPWAKLIKRKMP